MSEKIIGIIGAMSSEVQGIWDIMTNTECKKIAGLDFVKGNIGETLCVVSKCGPGKVNAAICAQAMIDGYNPEVVINTGVAGGIGKDVKIGDLVIGTHCVQHDMDTSELDGLVGVIPEIEITELPCDKEISSKIYENAKSIYNNVHTGVIATGDVFVGTTEKSNAINQMFGAIACEMEGGSIAQVCYMNNVKFAALRAISDNANDNGKVDYTTFEIKAADQSIELMRVSLAVI